MQYVTDTHTPTAAREGESVAMQAVVTFAACSTSQVVPFVAVMTAEQ